MKTICEGNNPSLLLQFILSELLRAVQAKKKKYSLESFLSFPTYSFPHDWSFNVGCLNKLKEHVSLLPHAFPNLSKRAKLFYKKLDNISTKIITKKKDPVYDHLHKDLKELYGFLQPFLIACKESEDLLLFLIKNAEKITEIAAPETMHSLLKKMFPEGLKEASCLILHNYKVRGFHSLLSEIEKIFTKL